MERFVKAIEEHTKALLLHAEALAKVGLAKVEGAAAPKPRGRPAAGETNGVADSPKENAAALTTNVTTVTSPSVSTATALGASAPAGLLNPKDLALLFVNTAKAKGASGRDFVTGILKEFNAATLDKITAEQQPAFVARLNGAPPAGIVAAVDDLASLLG